MTKPRTRLLMNQLIQQYQLVDAWSLINPDELGHTYFRPHQDGSVTSSRLDRIYIQEESLNNPTMCLITNPRNGGDHHAVLLQLKTLKISKPLFRHPDYLLEDCQYKQFLDTRIREFLIIHSQHQQQYVHEEHIQEGNAITRDDILQDTFYPVGLHPLLVAPQII